MNRPALPPSIPPEVLARQASLRAALEAMAAQGSAEPGPVQQLDAAAKGLAPLDPAAWLDQAQAAGLLEEAWERLRALRRDPEAAARLQAVAGPLEALAAKAQARRASRLHLDTRRALARIQYRKGDAARAFDDDDLQTLFVRALRLEGLRLDLDLGKRPRPLVRSDLPLPPGVGGEAEWLDVGLVREPAGDAEGLIARLNRRLPQGLWILAWQSLPVHASPLGDLARTADWRCAVPSGCEAAWRERLAAFEAREAFPWTRDGAKGGLVVDLRARFTAFRWLEGALHFESRLEGHGALNVQRALAAVLGMEAALPAGLTRLAIRLAPDPRLAQGERYQTKLKNMYEDAVPLSGGSNIVLIDEDDDEPLRLG